MGAYDSIRLLLINLGLIGCSINLEGIDFDRFVLHTSLVAKIINVLNFCSFDLVSIIDVTMSQEAVNHG